MNPTRSAAVRATCCSTRCRSRSCSTAWSCWRTTPTRRRRARASASAGPRSSRPRSPQARLHALELQTQPHFLFNTLNGIGALVRAGQNPEALTMIGGLSDLLRYALDRTGGASVPLDEEARTVERYLEIQRLRFPDRLAVDVALDGGRPRARRCPRCCSSRWSRTPCATGSRRATHRAGSRCARRGEGDDAGDRDLQHRPARPRRARTASGSPTRVRASRSSTATRARFELGEDDGGVRRPRHAAVERASPDERAACAC